MPDWLYTLRERFTSDGLHRWRSYVAFSGFTHIEELVTLDSMMCPSVIGDLIDEDWNYNVHEDFRTELFRDFDYLISRQPLDASRHQLLAIRECRDGHGNAPQGFIPCGFDIMDAYFGNSTLTNCGRIPEAFEPSLVNQWGLLSDFDVALTVRDRMRQLQPDDPHLGHCDVWQVARKLLGG